MSSPSGFATDLDHLPLTGPTHANTLVEGLVIMLAPFPPHFAEESWERLGNATSRFDARWPEWNEALTVEDHVDVVIQVSGKTRSRVSVPRDAEQGAVVEAVRRGVAVRRFTQGKEVRKVAHVPTRLLNLVVGSSPFPKGQRNRGTFPGDGLEPIPRRVPRCVSAAAALRDVSQIRRFPTDFPLPHVKSLETNWWKC